MEAMRCSFWGGSVPCLGALDVLMGIPFHSLPVVLLVVVGGLPLCQTIGDNASLLQGQI